MNKLSPLEAGKLVGKSKGVILRAINSGKLSAEQDEIGYYKIDPSELYRVYEAAPEPDHDPQDAASPAVNTTPANDENDTDKQKLQMMLAKLEAKLEERDRLQVAQESRIDDLKDQIDHLRKSLDAAQEERRQYLLSDQRATEQQPASKKGWFGFGRRSA